ncbi:TetR/AcrR family transcriptional regulator [Planosporangium mesophilum]|uniref:HTH tetR-type domain-containing protein n=1 Tax=Planosporangium mesophilum TaxID=689768 RepID=A0A8J3TEL7_9ACTN|nr:TetR/AcrR family transcriptional regulator [Planosporangium mesophilum]NJC86658.1 TetR family transcriptional regulator [Planosporangium mesophilum]GII25418.1 hypothetical protein Pme01_50150 [Planosporangium mesophilum]
MAVPGPTDLAGSAGSMRPTGSDAASSGEAPGLRERKKLETFRALQAAAQRLVGERGLDNVTIEEIAAAANVSKRTFFNYFDCKEAAVVDPDLGKVERLAAELAARPADESPLLSLWQATLVVLTHHAEGVQDLSGLVTANPGLAARQAHSYDRYRKVTIEWAAERTGVDPDRNVYPALLATIGGLMAHLSVTRWEPGSGVEGHVRLSDEIFRLIAHGLAAPCPGGPVPDCPNRVPFDARTATDDGPLGLRERKKFETFQALQGAAHRLVLERGLDNVTVEEIAAAANVSKRTFFNYFESKEAALIDPEPGKPEWLAAALAARPASETPLEALWAAAVDLLVRDAPILRALSGLIAANPTLAARQAASFARFQRVIEAWAAERTGVDPDTNLYPALLAAIGVAAVRLTLERWRPETGDEGYLRSVQEILDLLRTGLAAPLPDTC